MIYRRKTMKSIASAILLCFTSLTGAQPLYAIPANTQLPTGPDGTVGKPYGVLDNVTTSQNGNSLTITQEGKTSVLEWGDFSIGADAAVEFKSTVNDFNSLNYVTNGPVSEIYGQLTALGGNIFIANPAGVQIGNSAQINVGSLYVTNKDIGEEALKNIHKDSQTSDIVSAIDKYGVAAANAELMSLGGIVAPKGVTFDGGRIVIDADRLYADTDGKELDTSQSLTIKTTDKDNVVIGYTADFEEGTFSADSVNKEFKLNADSSVTSATGVSNTLESVTGYTWIKNLRHLQAMDTVTNNGSINGWFALRNSIEAYYTGSEDYDFGGNNGSGFKPIGDATNKFTGRFDGLGFDIFDLNIKRGGTDNVGLFGYAENAIIRNFTLNAGVITGGNNTGAVVGSASGGTIENIVNTADVKGGTNTGGVVGNASGTKLSGLINVGTVSGADTNSIGGIVGSINGGKITGTTYNLGAVAGAYDVGGIAGSAKNTTIGNEGTDPFVIYNELDVTGGYNVGGIAGNIEGTKVLNVANYGEILANSSKRDTYSYHTADTTIGAQGNDHYITGTNYVDGIASIEVQAANAGGIVGNASEKSYITNADNTGDVTTSTTDDGGTVGTYYNAGNVGGIVGSAVDTSVTNSMNKENKVAGAHNVGGIAGYMAGSSTIDTSVNNGGDITATGARRAENDNINNGFAQERVRAKGHGESDETFNIGNIGGVVGYIYGDDARVSNSSNRGTAHSAEIDTQNSTVLTNAKAANVGGVAGKISSGTKTTLDDEFKKGYADNATVANSYNTGGVRGYTGVGGIAGMMHNGSVAGSYNLGSVMSSRASTVGGTVDALNMGGIVGDTTEGTDARAVIYNVYNSGVIGDKEYKYYGRHVGGVVGRLSGTVEKAYNTGEIWNGYNVVGGIAGWWYAGNIKDTFNTGNITVQNYNNATSQVGGIVGGVDISPDAKTLSYSYNLGTLRSFKPPQDGTTTYGNNNVGGIVGGVYSFGGNSNKLTIDNVYTAGHLYAATRSGNGYTSDGMNGLGAIVAYYDGVDVESNVTLSENTNYITPGSSSFSIITNPDANNTVEYKDKSTSGKYMLTELQQMNAGNKFDVADTGWRLYDNGTPILNSFTPAAETFFSQDGNRDGITSVQYGTAYNPLLTIIDAKGDLKFDWSSLGISGAGGLAVYGDGDLTLEDFASSGANTYFGGMIYSDGALTLNGAGENFNLGSASSLYGSSVTLTNNGGLTIYGDVTSTNGGINITSGGDVEVIGRLKASLSGDTTTIPGISPEPETIDNTKNYNNPDEQMQTITERFSHTTDKAEQNGDITVEAGGAVQLLFGNLGEGNVTTGGDLSVKGSSVYIDTDLDIGEDFNLESDGEMLVDLSHMLEIGKETLHGFLDHFKKGATGDAKGSINVTGDNFKIAVDMWDYDDDKFDYTKYDDDDGHTFESDTKAINLNVNGSDVSGSDYAYIWISDAEQLKGIQKYYSEHKNGHDILGDNFALKNDIDASKLEDYAAIGTDAENGFTGTFDGRGFRIIGLTAGGTINGAAETPPSSAGVFGKIGEGGTVKDLRVYASYFYGNDYAGTIAGINEGKITGVTTLGNHVEAFGSDNSMELQVHNANGDTIQKNIGAAGGVAGYNTGTITGVTTSDSIVAGDPKDGNNTGGLDAKFLTTAGGVAGINEGEISNVTADSALTADENTTLSLGGVAGVNQANDIKVGSITGAYSTGVLHGEYGPDNITTNSAGGIAGVNTGTIDEVYNESDITGGSYVGGVVGYNYTIEDVDDSGIITDIANAGGIQSNATDSEGKYYGYTGGIAGYNDGKIDDGRNAGTINGGNYVGGMVGSNGASSVISNLVNSVFAAITGENYVGGIAGQNYGKIDAENTSLNNYGQVTGQQYVGGIAGANEEGGEITNTISSIALHVKDKTKRAQYFGGVAGQNSGKIIGATNENDVDVAAGDAIFVGGIVGENTETGTFEGTIANKGTISGLSNVGGIAGVNNNINLLAGKEDATLFNSGSVRGGGAAGIFYSNTGDIFNKTLVNSGKITNTGSGADAQYFGGLFGKNSGEITNSTLTNNGLVEGGGAGTGGIIGQNSGSAENSVFTNSGTVSGAGNVGGLFGSNSGDFKNSSLFATVEAKVTGTGDNVGGLIGYNTGTITGGRGAGENGMELYKHQIYNNGSVKGANNVGGLIGYNAAGGSLTAAYNTGEVSGAADIGGIVGENEGTVSTVFNTIMTFVNGEVQEGEVNGQSNVGGLIGMNSGTLSDAYNTTGVKATAGDVAGNAVGENATGGTVSNVYATNATDSKLIGYGIEAVNGYNLAADDGEAKMGASYNGFNISDKASDETIWRIYEGYSTPLLRVFLTDASYNGEDNKFTYNADMQGIKDLDNVRAADGLNGSEISNIAKVLLTALEQKNAGENYLAFSSTQIAASNGEEGFNPNNLGYDIDATFSIGKASLTVNDIIASIVYGGNEYKIKDGTLDGVFEGDNVGLDVNFAGMSKKDLDELIVKDSKYDESKGGRATADVLRGENGDVIAYENSLYASNLTLQGKDAANYELTNSTVSGKIKVTPAPLTITLDDVKRTYGDTAFIDGTGYGIVHADGLVNGDENNTSALELKDDAVIEDGGILDSGRTNNAGDYEWTVEEGDYTNAFSGIKTGNYNITVTAGKSEVTPKTLSISNILATIVYGDQDGKGLTVNKGASLTEGSIVYGDNVELAFDGTYSVTGVYEENRGTRTTADVGRYENSLKADGLVLTGQDAGNYTLADTDAHGSIEVTPAALTVSLNGVSHTYGNRALTNGTSYGIADISGVVNDDSYTYTDLELGAVADGALVNDGTARQTQNVGNHKWTASVTSNIALLNQNYKIKVQEGDSAIEKAQLTLNINDISTIYGTAFDEDKYGYRLDGVTNGDSSDVLKTLLNVAYKNDAALDGTDGRVTKDAGTYDIDVENKDMLNLRNYNITKVKKGTATVDKAPLTITLNNVEHNYGTVLDADAIGYRIESTDGLVNGDDGAQLTFNAETAKDKDKAIYYHEDGGEWRTNDANGDYSYLGDIEDAFKAGVSRANYYANDGGAVNLDNYDVEYKGGKSVVKPKELGISDILATIVYGNQGGAGFKVAEGGNLTGIVYDDDVSFSQELKIEDAKFATDGSYEINRNGRTTADAGDNYAQKLTFNNLQLFGRHAGNYTVNGNVDAAIAVTRAQLSVTAHDKLTQLGREPEYTGTTYDELNGSLVNGDDLSGFMHAFGIEEAEMLNNAGHYPGKIGVVVNGLYYYDGTHDWSGHHDVFTNYDVNVAAGSLRVFVPVPDSSFNYGWLYDDAPYSRKWNFRERKAEIYFQDGGMEYDKNM